MDERAGPRTLQQHTRDHRLRVPGASLRTVCTTVDRLWDVGDNLFEYYVTNEALPDQYAGLDEYNTAEVNEC